MKHISFLFILTLLFFSCIEDLTKVDEIQFEQEDLTIAIPLVHSRFYIEDALDDLEGEVNVDVDNFISLFYTQKDILSIAGEEIFQIEDFPLPMLDTVLTVPFAGVQSDYELEFVELKSGMLDINFESLHAEDLNVIIEVTNLVKDGIPFTISIPIDYNNSSPISFNESIPLEDYTMDLQEGTLDFRYSSINANGDFRVLSNGLLEFKDLKFQHARGNFGQLDFELAEDSIFIELLSELVDGDIYLEDPKMKLTVENGMGIPIQVYADYMTAQTKTGTVQFTSPLDQGVDIDFPSITEIGTVKNTVLSFDQTNSNFVDLINSQMSALNFKLDALTNPTSSPNNIGFLNDDSQINLDLEVEIPLWLRAEELALEETEELEVSIFNDFKELEFKILTKSIIPTNCTFQFYFEDANALVLDSLFTTDSNIINSPTLDAMGEVLQPSESELIASLDNETIRKIEEASHIRIKVVFSTPSQTSAKFYADQYLDLKIGIRGLVN